MDETVLRRLAADISALAPDAAVDAADLKLLLSKYGATALSAGSPIHVIGAACEAIELIKRLERGEAGIEREKPI